MFCRNCGNEVAENQEICLKCGVRPLVGDKHCQNCGVEVNPNQELCIKCGVRLLGGAARGHHIVTPSAKSPATAAVLSFLILGVGQMYLGQVLKGVAMMLAGMVLASITGFIALPVLWIVYPLDAYLIGKKLISGKTVGMWECF